MITTYRTPLWRSAAVQIPISPAAPWGVNLFPRPSPAIRLTNLISSEGLNLRLDNGGGAGNASATLVARALPAGSAITTTPDGVTEFVANTNIQASGIGLRWQAAEQETNGRYLYAADMWRFMLGAAAGAGTPVWSAVDLYYSAPVLSPEWTAGAGTSAWDVGWPSVSTVATVKTVSECTPVGLLWTGPANAGRRRKMELNFARYQSTLNLFSAGELPTIGEVSPRPSTAQLRVLDARITGLTHAASHGDCAVFTLQGGTYDDANDQTRLFTLGSTVTLPGGWAAVGPKAIAGSADGPGAGVQRTLSMTEVGLYDLIAPPVLLPSALDFIVVRSWHSVAAYANQPETSIRLGLTTR